MTDPRQENSHPTFDDPSHALLKATIKGDLHKVICSIENGAKLAINQNGHTALHIAAYKGYLDIVRVLLNCGCDLDIPDDHGDTALHRACIGGHDNVVKRLLEEGCCINRQNESGYTGLHEAAYRGFSRIVNHLITHKANILCKNKHGDTAIHLAAANGHSGSLRILLMNCPKPSITNCRQETPLHLSVKFNHVTSSRVLISAKSVVDFKDENGNTSLHIATITRNKKLSRILLDAGASAAVCNKENKTPLDIARKANDGELIYIIMSGPRPPCSMPHRGRSSKRHHHSRRRTKSEPRKEEPKHAPVSSKRSQQAVKDELQQRPKSATLPRKALRHRFKRSVGNLADCNKDLLTDCQTQTKVQTYIVPQLYSLYRDEEGEVKQKPVISKLPNPTPEIVTTLTKEVENTKGELLKEINKKTHHLSNKLNRLSEKTEHKFHKLDKITSQRINAERSHCLHRIDRRATLERTISHRLVSESLKSWIQRKKENEDLSGKLQMDSTKNFSQENHDSGSSEVEEKPQSPVSKFIDANASANLTDSAYDSLQTCLLGSQGQPFKNYGHSFPRSKHETQLEYNIQEPAQVLTYNDTADLTAHVTQHLFENVSTAMEQWYEKRLKDATEQRNIELSRRVAVLEEQLRNAKLNPNNPAEDLV